MIRRLLLAAALAAAAAIIGHQVHAAAVDYIAHIDQIGCVE